MMNERGKKLALTSMILGIASIVCCFFGIGSVISVGAGIVGIVLAVKAKSDGFSNGIRVAGFVTSIVGLVFGAIVMLFWIMCGGLMLLLA